MAGEESNMKKTMMIISFGVLVGAMIPGCALHTRSAVVEVGDKAPDFDLSDAEGTHWRLADMVSDGPAVVMFYRGYW